MRHTGRGVVLGIIAILLLAPSAALAGPGKADPPPVPTDDQVESFINLLQEELFKRQIDHYTVHCDGVPAVAGPARGNRGALQCKALAPRGSAVTLTLLDGKTIDVPTASIRRTMPPGHFGPPYGGGNYAGAETDMAMWALVCSGMNLQDPRMVKAINSYNETLPPTATYTLSFRLNTYSHLLRWGRDNKRDSAYRRLLGTEAEVMVLALSQAGNYGYTSWPPPGYTNVGTPAKPKWQGKPPPHGGDNSNTQFGQFGVWAAEDAEIEAVPYSYWQRTAEHWLRSQDPASGGWGYHSRGGASKNMTDAGLNSLYLVVDKYLSRQAQGGYRFLSGVTYHPQAVQEMSRIFAAINKGWAWCEGPGKAMAGGHGLYHHYGMQRLGLISGRKYIGGRAWYPEVVQKAYSGGQMPRDAGGSVIEISWRLMCLAFGRAPVLVNKLSHGSDESDWNYYFRDVANLMDWMSHRTEKRCNWQILEVDAPFHDYQDAPFLLISGGKDLKFTDEQLRKIKRFADFGGTILLHPNRNSPTFTASARKVFGKLFDNEFRKLPPEHPIYSAPYTPKEKAKGMTAVPLFGMSDGGRDFCILFGGDVAGAWQLRLDSSEARLFWMMLNLRQYGAPHDYNRLPRRLRPITPQPQGGKAVVIARLRHGGNSRANPTVYEALAPHIGPFTLEVRDQVEATEQALAGAHLIHVTGHGDFQVTQDQAAAIAKAVQNGALLIIDPAYGRAEFTLAADELVRKLALTARGGSWQTGPFFAGITSLHGTPEFRTTGAFAELCIGEKIVGLLSKVDITAAANGHWVHGYPGIGTAPARQIWANIIARAAGAN